jgi:hypothetical protein
VQVLVLEPSGKLVRAKTFFLGINRFVRSTGRPANDRIRRIIFRPALGGLAEANTIDASE